MRIPFFKDRRKLSKQTKESESSSSDESSPASDEERFFEKAKDSIAPHLQELRSRLLRVVIVITVIFLGLYGFSGKLYTLLAIPLLKHLPVGNTLIATGITSPFLAPLKLTLALSCFIAMPFILHQLWSFIAPALYKHERRFVSPILLLSVLLFYAGAAFAYFVIFPLVFGFFTRVAPEGVSITPDISAYLDFTLKLFFSFGITFEVPIVTVLLIWSGLVSVESLSKKRPYIIVFAFVAGMLLTPPDVISQILLAVPLWALFEIGLLVAKMKPALQAHPETASSLDGTK